MIEVLEKPSLRLSSRRVQGRAVNAVASLLRSQLSVPNIYLDPRIAGIACPEVLAVDRAGSGDLHAVKIKAVSKLSRRTELRTILAELMHLPFHFKYLALPQFLTTMDGPFQFADYPELFDESGIGRVGILAFDATVLDSSTASSADAVRLVLRPERFRVAGKEIAAIERFLARAAPDMAVRV